MAVVTKSKVTIDHEEIRRWAAERSGKPAARLRPKSGVDRDGFIRIHFPDDRLEGSTSEISWETWFKKFDEAGLALLYQEHTAGGEKSTFNKLVSREIVDKVESAVGGKGRSASRRQSRRADDIGEIATPFTRKVRRDGLRDASSRKAGKKSKAAGIVAAEKKQKLTWHVSRSGNSEAPAPGARAESTANPRRNPLTPTHQGEI